MILIDERIGSVDLMPLFPPDLVQISKLEFGDFCFIGNNITTKIDEPLQIGIERKTIYDFLSSMTSGRLSGHQIPGLLNSYNVVYIILEGMWRIHPQNKIIETYQAKQWAPIRYGPRVFYARELYNFINTINVLCGIHCVYTTYKYETAQLVTSLYYWWTEKYLDEHKSHRQKHRPLIDINTKVPPLLYRVAAELPGIGSTKSRLVTNHFRNLTEMVLASEEEWCKIPGIGKPTAKRLVKTLQEDEQR